MAIVRWATFDLGPTSDFDELVRRTFGDDGSSLLGRSHWAPAIDAFVDGDRLHVSGERRQEERTEGDGWFRSEMRYGSFDRRIALPEGVDAESVAASYENGILDVTVPMPAKDKTKVKVAVGNGKQLIE